MSKVQEAQRGDIRVNRANALRHVNRANALRHIGRLCYAIGSNALPAPNAVSFIDDILSLQFDTAEDAQEWAEHLSGELPRHRTYQPEWNDEPIHSFNDHAHWLGFTVAISGWSPVTEGPGL